MAAKIEHHEKCKFQDSCTGSGFCHFWKAGWAQKNPESGELEVHTVYRHCERRNRNGADNGRL